MELTNNFQTAMDVDSTLVAKTELIDHMNLWLKHSGIRPDIADTLDKIVMTAIILVIALVVDLICRYPILGAIKHIVAHIHTKWAKLIYDPVLLKKLADLVPIILVYVLIPIAFPREPEILKILQKLCMIYIIVVTLMFFNLLLKVGYHIYIARESLHDRPLKGLLQIMQVGLFCIGGIIIISELFGKSPLKLFAGLGASAAILMLIFKDSILGFVSGIQLSANDMLRKGDWITLSKYEADGTVIEVSLTTVKIQNFDNTIVTLPPYILTSDAFQNWRGMEESGGRRIQRSVNIDISSVRFCTPEMIEKYKKVDLVRGFIEKREAEIAEKNRKKTAAAPGKTDTPHKKTTAASLKNAIQHQIPGTPFIPEDRDDTTTSPKDPLPDVSAADVSSGLADMINRQALTNLTVFRAYLSEYLKRSELVNKDLTCMVRHLQPTSEGVPIQLYFFTYTKEWVAYEGIQSEIFEHVMSVVPQFDLYIYQTPSGIELSHLNVPSGEQEKTTAAAASPDTPSVS